MLKVRMRRNGFLSLVLVTLYATAGAPAQAGSASRKTPVVEAVQKVMPCTVSISSEKKAASNSRWPFSHEENQRPRVSGMGTGVIIDGRGYILTNQHVVDKVQGIEVRLSDGTTYPARLIQQDETLDLAMIKIDAGRILPAVAIGSSSDIMIGEQVITIGNAFGYENTVSVGIISFVGRNVTLADDQVYHNLIQTDACINPGNSGGPLVNIDGELIGLNVAVRAGAQGIGFALPIDDVKRVATEMLSTRKLTGSWHGLVAGETRLGANRAVVISDVPPSSPADVAGILRGDQVMRVGDLAVTNTLDIERGFLNARPGVKQEVMIRRGGQEKLLSLDVRAVAKATSDPAERVWRTLGVRAVPVNGDLVRLAAPSCNGGLYVQTVANDSPAARGAIQKGDILVGVRVIDKDWETIQLDNVVYVLNQSELAQTQTLRCWIVRRNELIQSIVSLSDLPIANARK